MKHLTTLTFALVFAVSSLMAQATKQDLNRYIANQDYDNAGKIVEEVIKANSEDATTLLLCGDVYAELDNYNRASEVYKMADKADRGEWKTYLKIGAACSLDSNYTEASQWFNKALDKINKKKVNDLNAARLEYADALIRADSLNKAEKIIVSVRTKDEKNPIVYLKLGNLYFAQKIYQLAETNYKEVLVYDENNVQAHINLAVCYYWLGNSEQDKDLRNTYYQRCLDEWKIVSELDPKNAKAWYMQGKILFFAEKYNASTLAFEKYCELRPSDIDARWMLGKSYFEANKCDDARQNLEMVAQQNDSLKDAANLMLAQCFYQSKEYVQSIAKYKVIKKLPMADRRRLGLAYLNSGDSLTAYKTWQDAYRDSSEDLNNLNYIRITALQMGSMKPKMRVEAIEMCELWLANPQAPEEYKPAMYYTAGLHMLFLDSLDSELDTTNRALTRKSIEYFNKSIALDSQYVYAWFYMGDAYSRIDSTEKAIISFDEAIKICQSDTAKYSKSFTLIYNKLCGLHYTNKDWPALIDASTRWTVDEPKVEWGWLYLGIANYYAENNSAAKAALRKCISINPANKSAKGLLQQMEGAGK